MKYALSAIVLMLSVSACVHAQTPVIELQVGDKLKVASLDPAQGVLFVPERAYATCVYVENGEVVAYQVGTCGFSTVIYINGQLVPSSTPVMVRVSTTPTPTPTPTNLLASYSFSENSGTATVDSSGNNQNATLVGATWTAGKYGSGLSFNGTSQYVAATDIDFPAGPFTLSGWFKTTTVGPRVLLSKYASGTNQIYVLITASGRLLAGLYDGIDWQEVETAQEMLTDGFWHHFAMVVSTTTVQLYIDGALNGSDTHDNSFPVNNIVWNIGRRNNGTAYFQGSLDSIRLYSKALNSAELALDMNTP